MFNQAWRRSFLVLIFVSSLVLSLGWGQITLSDKINFNHPVIAQTTDVNQGVNEGIEQYKRENYTEAIKIWQEILYASLNSQEKQIVLENIARAYQKLGQTKKALESWSKVAEYAKNDESKVKLGQILTEQAQLYLNLGQPQTAIALLCQSTNEKTCQLNTALAIARNNQDLPGEVAALGTLAEAFRLSGKYDQSIRTLETALSLSPSLYQASLKQSLGNALTARGQLWKIRAESDQEQGIFQSDAFKTNAIADYQQAEINFRSSLQLTEDPLNKLENLLNLIRLSYYSQKFQLISTEKSEIDLQKALNLLESVPPTATTVYASIDLATLPDFSLPLENPLAQCPSKWQLSVTKRQDILKNALNISKTLNNPRSESFALGALGHFYECQEDLKTALTITQQAILVANQSLSAQDSLYLWEWQKGRILNTQGLVKGAINAYQDAYNTLETIRSELLTAERDVQFDFRDSIEPIYRQLTELQLELTDSTDLSPQERKQYLAQALTVTDSLRLAELQNYLGNDCFLRIDSPISKSLSSLTDTATINLLIFADKTAIILTLPDENSRIHWIQQNRANILAILRQFRQQLQEGQLALGDYDITLSKQLYEWIIQPFASDLTENNIKTLIFIKDSLFRTIPMAALHDGKQFLIEKYAIATTPSLALTAIEESTFSKNKALILGVTEESKIDGQIFPALSNISLEIATVSQQFPNHQPLINAQFNANTLAEALDNADYPIIHIATHAQFGAIADDTFLVAGNNAKITINNLELILNRLREGSDTVELLTLTACETAEGNERSALGLAGVAIQAGVKSAIASLWSVSDESTLQLVSAFYENLVNSGVSKAEALRQAQIKLIQAKQYPEINNQYNNPFYWAAFTLIGNWL